MNRDREMPGTLLGADYPEDDAQRKGLDDYCVLMDHWIEKAVLSGVRREVAVSLLGGTLLAVMRLKFIDHEFLSQLYEITVQRVQNAYDDRRPWVEVPENG